MQTKSTLTIKSLLSLRKYLLSEDQTVEAKEITKMLDTVAQIALQYVGKEELREEGVHICEHCSEVYEMGSYELCAKCEREGREEDQHQESLREDLEMGRR